MLIVVLYSPLLVVAINITIILHRSGDDEASEGAEGGKMSVADEATDSPKNYDEPGRCGSAANFLFSILIEGRINPPPDGGPPVWPLPDDGPPTDAKGNSRPPPESPEGNARPPPDDGSTNHPDCNHVRPTLDDGQPTNAGGNSRTPPESYEGDV